MDFPIELVELSKRFAILIGENTVPTIIDKISVAKSTNNKEQAIKQLEEIIMGLISEKNELIKIVQAYEQELIVRKISDEDVNYITDKMFPLLEELAANSGDEPEKVKEGIEILKPVISKETFNILQLLGFNFKQAIGEPLTELVRASISSKIPLSGAATNTINELVLKRDIEYWKMIQNPDAFERHLEHRKE